MNNECDVAVNAQGLPSTVEILTLFNRPVAVAIGIGELNLDLFLPEYFGYQL